MMQFISYMVKNGVTVTIGTYIGRNLCHYSHIARNELKKSTTLNLICTHFPGHILFTSLNTWMLPCILQEASILFFSGSFCCCNS